MKIYFVLAITSLFSVMVTAEDLDVIKENDPLVSTSSIDLFNTYDLDKNSEICQ